MEMKLGYIILINNCTLLLLPATSELVIWLLNNPECVSYSSQFAFPGKRIKIILWA